MPRSSASSLLDAVRDEFGDVLVCPSCAGPLRATADESAVECAGMGCGRVAAARESVLDFVSIEHDDRGQQAGFAFQWESVLRGSLENSIVYNNTVEDLKRWLCNSMRMKPEDFKGKRFLDLGCGHGQYCRAAASMGAAAMGVDLSVVVYRATAENETSGRRFQTTYVRADVHRLPFAPGMFDVVISIGMCHHTPDTKRGALVAARCVNVGGLFMFYSYEPGAVGYITLRHAFPLPSRFPRPLMLATCQLIALPLCLWLAGRHSRLPTARTYRSALLGLLDAYLPTYSWTHTKEECMSWMREAGLDPVDNPNLGRCTYVGRRPA